MTDHTDLIARLRDTGHYVFEDCEEAADALEAQARRIAELEREIERKDLIIHKYDKRIYFLMDKEKEKDARIAELEAALRPFTDVESIVPFFHDAGWGLYAHVVTKRDMEAARAALEKK